MKNNCSTCMYGRSCAQGDNVKVCLNAGTFVYDIYQISNCPAYEATLSVQK